MIPLSSNKIELHNFENKDSFFVKVSENKPSEVNNPKEDYYIIKDNLAPIPVGFAGYIGFDQVMDLPNFIKLEEPYKYISDNDVLRINPMKKQMRVMYRRNSSHNSLLVTEQCNHLCLMCSQPPRNIDDSYIAKEILDLVPLMHPDTKQIGITGGEPTLNKDNFIKIIKTIKDHLPSVSLHVLTNGRNFIDNDFCKTISESIPQDTMFGIPLYSDNSTIHDYVVQSENAFDETLVGIINMNKHRIPIEIRFVINKQTYKRLPEFAEFISRNLQFVNHIAFMGLEITGYTRTNLDDLWIDPVHYQEELFRAVDILDKYNSNISIYNQQLCTVDERLHKYYRKSISDWKNIYLDDCANCSKMDECGGFFTSSLKKHTDHIKPFT